MYHAERNILAATNEQMFLHVKVSDGKSVPFFPETRARLEQVYAAHRHLPWPGQAGRAIGMPRRKAS